jgi:hypothetical protein
VTDQAGGHSRRLAGTKDDNGRDGGGCREQETDQQELAYCPRKPILLGRRPGVKKPLTLITLAGQAWGA